MCLNISILVKFVVDKTFKIFRERSWVETKMLVGSYTDIYARWVFPSSVRPIFSHSGRSSTTKRTYNRYLSRFTYVTKKKISLVSMNTCFILKRFIVRHNWCLIVVSHPTPHSPVGLHETNLNKNKVLYLLLISIMFFVLQITPNGFWERRWFPFLGFIDRSFSCLWSPTLGAYVSQGRGKKEEKREEGYTR